MLFIIKAVVCLCMAGMLWAKQLKLASFEYCVLAVFYAVKFKISFSIVCLLKLFVDFCCLLVNLSFRAIGIPRNSGVVTKAHYFNRTRKQRNYCELNRCSLSWSLKRDYFVLKEFFAYFYHYFDYCCIFGLRYLTWVSVVCIYVIDSVILMVMLATVEAHGESLSQYDWVVYNEVVQFVAFIVHMLLVVFDECNRIDTKNDYDLECELEVVKFTILMALCMAWIQFSTYWLLNIDFLLYLIGCGLAIWVPYLLVEHLSLNADILTSRVAPKKKRRCRKVLH